MNRRTGKGAPRATAPAATPEPAIYYKASVTREEAFQAIGRLRKEARDEIDRLIRFLDDTEQVDADHEDSDPPEESEASGIADQDGLDEQVPFRDWQGVGMV